MASKKSTAPKEPSEPAPAAEPTPEAKPAKSKAAPKSAPKGEPKGATATATAPKSSAKKTAPAAETNGKAPKKQPIKDPKGGLTDAGREHFKQTEGANLQPGVQGAADTPDKMKRKGSFLVRHYSNPKPLTGEDGKPSRYALQARAWGEKIPKTEEDIQALAAKGHRLLEKYKKQREKEKATKKAEAKTARDAAKAEKAAAKK